MRSWKRFSVQKVSEPGNIINTDQTHQISWEDTIELVFFFVQPSFRKLRIHDKMWTVKYQTMSRLPSWNYWEKAAMVGGLENPNVLETRKIITLRTNRIVARMACKSENSPSSLYGIMVLRQWYISEKCWTLTHCHHQP